MESPNGMTDNTPYPNGIVESHSSSSIYISTLSVTTTSSLSDSNISSNMSSKTGFLESEIKTHQKAKMTDIPPSSPYFGPNFSSTSLSDKPIDAFPLSLSDAQANFFSTDTFTSQSIISHVSDPFYSSTNIKSSTEYKNDAFKLKHSIPPQNSIKTSLDSSDYSGELSYERKETKLNNFNPELNGVSGSERSEEETNASFEDTINGIELSKSETSPNFDDTTNVVDPTKGRDISTVQLHHMATTPQQHILPSFDIDVLTKGMHSDPFSILGPHYYDTHVSQQVNGGSSKYINKTLIIRSWIKDGKEAFLKFEKPSGFSIGGDLYIKMKPISNWLFEAAFSVDIDTNKLSAYEAEHPHILYELNVRYTGDVSNKQHSCYDTYQFGLISSDFDLKLFQSGSCWHVDGLMGSHKRVIEGVEGISFCVWAPNCANVSVVGDWNGWHRCAHPMRKRVEYSVWELFIPNCTVGHKYGYNILTKNHQNFVKIDPYAQEFEIPPQTASIISSCDDDFKPPEERFKWNDEEWMKQREEDGRADILRRKPISIYEVHLPSWMKGDNNSYLGYKELADRLVKHLLLFNFTHVEFLPLAQHPFEGSWGYQVSGLFAPYSRLGSPDDFKYLVDKLHQNNIGVFLDWVPAHFCTDQWALSFYDSAPCYEYADPREGLIKAWGTKVFNFRRTEVRSFLLGAAYHWLRRYHIDGLRIDAVSSMLYKNHGRPNGEWIPNEMGGDANLEAISLLKEMNWVISHQFPGVFTMAEESTSWEGVTNKHTGLGFDAKWDLGWMNDTLSYLCKPQSQRSEKHSKLTFRGLYQGHERWILPLSHDEVVNGKGSLLDKCGSLSTPFEERLRTLRTLYGFQIGLPGRPLLFMGAEFGQGREWSASRSVDWHEMEEPLRKKTSIWVQDLLKVYKTYVALHAGDDEIWNFKWIDCDNSHDCIVAFLRSYMDWTNDVLVICNFSSRAYHRYPFGTPHGGKWEVILNSDDWKYGGTMYGLGRYATVRTTVGGRIGWPYCLWLDVPPFGCLYLCPHRPPQKKETPTVQLTDPEIKQS